jgi:putative membrane protein
MSDNREPRVFAPDDPNILPGETGAADWEAIEQLPSPPASSKASRGASIGGIFISAVTALVGLALSVSFAQFVATALARNDWVGWTATSLALIAALAALIIMGREIAGLLKLGHLARIRRDVAVSLRTKDRTLERKTVRALRTVLRRRPDLAWALARVRDHERDVHDPGELLKLADRELMAPLDAEARRAIIKSAKRVSVVTAMSPMVWVAMLYVMVENLRMLRTLSTLYGARPGGLGALRLARMVVTHIVATGGLAMTDDLLGQFLGQDLLRRLSRRLGEGAFNGALTARIGTAAIDVVRPLPFLETRPVRARDLLPDLFRRTSDAAASDSAEKTS